MNEQPKQVGAAGDGVQRGDDRITQVANVPGQEVRAAVVFRVVPDVLGRVKLRGIGRNPLALHRSGIALDQARRRRTLHVPSVPHQDDASSQASSHSANESARFVGGDVVRVDGELQPQAFAPRSQGEGGEHRQPVAAIPGYVNRRLPARGPGASHRRMQPDAAFVAKNDATLAPCGVFLWAASQPDASAP